MDTVNDTNRKAVIVTGAASGLGRAAAIKLAQAGSDVCIVDMNAQGLEDTAVQLRKLGAKCLVQATDLSQPDNCAVVVAAAVNEFGRLDALCNVAGVIVMCNAHEMPITDWDKTMAVNLSAPFHLMQAAIPHLLLTDGAVVNVTSSAAFVGEAYAGAYCASKAALTHLTKALAMEYVHQPIRFNAVAPGGMHTNMGHTIRMPDGANMDLIKRFSGLRGLVDVDDVADAIAMLASDAGRGYHGACINIDKGITAG